MPKKPEQTPDIQPTQKAVNPASQRLLKALVAEFNQNLQALATEAMQIDGVDAEQGWKLDLESMQYVKQDAKAE